MPQFASWALPVAQQEAEVLARIHLQRDLFEDGSNDKSESDAFRAHHSFLPFPSSYRLLLQIEFHRGGRRHLYNYYFLLIEQWNKEYRIEDLQVVPEI